MSKHITDWMDWPDSENVFELEEGEIIITKQQFHELIYLARRLNAPMLKHLTMELNPIVDGLLSVILDIDKTADKCTE